MYILEINFEMLGPTCYVRANEKNGTWDEIFDPAHATKFSSKKKAREWADRETTMAEYISVIQESEAKAKFNAWYDNGMIRRTLSLVDNSFSRPYNGEDKYKILEWQWEHTTSEEDRVRFEDYKTWPDLYQVFNHLHGFVSYSDEEGNPFHSVEIYTSKDGVYEDFKTELDLVIDRLNHFDNEGNLIIDVFDHYLSEGGNTVFLVAMRDGKWRIDSHYGHDFGPTTLKKCFEYIRKNRYYK